MKRIPGWLKDYNDFSKSDRSAILILCGLICLAIIAIAIVDLIPTKTEYNYAEYRQLLQEMEAPGKGHLKFEKSLFSFDPNVISAEKLDSLDIPQFVKRNILNYRKAGGRFKSSKDFRKIYGMNDSIFMKLESYISISANKSTFEKDPKEKNWTNTSNPGNKVFNEPAEIIAERPLPKTKYETLQVELNSADSTELMKLNGVGAVYANRIIKYRNLLGGFYSTSQLLEVYNFPPETFKNIEKNILVDTLSIKKIRLNFSEFSELLRHPYLNKDQVAAILKHRDKNGSFQEVLQLKTNGLLDDEAFAKVRPYLTCR
jgi:DNA uptake protein ComE-like DNA-binding protein